MSLSPRSGYTNIPEDVFSNFKKDVLGISWYERVPGGFLTNSPRRQVRTFGDGGYSHTHWTASIKSSSCTLRSKTTPLPDSFKQLIPHLTRLFKQQYPSSKITPATFSLAVCNYYTTPDSYIAAHTDDNIWYPRECDEGPVFASITFYPEGEPDFLHRFQIKQKTWEPLNLRDGDILVMPSSIPHRVQPYFKKHYKFFKPRINITFRSMYEKEVNPLLHAMCVSNHTRYYGLPSTLIVRDDTSKETKEELIKIYTSFCSRYNSTLQIIEKKNNRKEWIVKLKQKIPCRITSNITQELIEQLDLSLD